MFKPKAQNFRKEIRREYLNEYFKKKRKQFNLIPDTKEEEQMSMISKIHDKVYQAIVDNNKIVPDKGIPNLQELQMIAKFSQIQMGVQCLTKTNIPAGTLPYLSSLYHNTQQQHLATCIFANITFIKPQIYPSNQFMRNITNIIQNTDTTTPSPTSTQSPSHHKFMLHDTIDNCLLIIYHLMVDFPDALTFYITECSLVPLMYSMYESCTDTSTMEKILKIMALVTAWHKGKKERHLVRKFLKGYISIFENTNENPLVYLALANIRELLAVYVDAIQPESTGYGQWDCGAGKNTQGEKDLHEIVAQIMRSKLLNKMIVSYPNMDAKVHVTRCMFFILKIMLTKMDRETVEKKLFNLLSKMIDYIYNEQTKDPTAQASIFTPKHSQTPQQRHSQNIYIRTQFYQIIYAFLQIWPSDHDLLTNHPLFQKMCNKYKYFQDTNTNDMPFAYETREYFIYVFGMLVFSEKLSTGMRNVLRKSIDRWRDGVREEKHNDWEDTGSFEGFVDNVEKELGQEQVEYEI